MEFLVFLMFALPCCVMAYMAHKYSKNDIKSQQIMPYTNEVWFEALASSGIIGPNSLCGITYTVRSLKADLGELGQIADEAKLGQQVFPSYAQMTLYVTADGEIVEDLTQASYRVDIAVQGAAEARRTAVEQAQRRASWDDVDDIRSSAYINKIEHANPGLKVGGGSILM